MADKVYWSYEQIHEIIRSAVQDRKIFQDFKPSLLVAIGAGGYLPARILRTYLKQELGRNLPIQAIGLQLYDVEGSDPTTAPVTKTQWLRYGAGEGCVRLQGQHIVIVDEVDDSRKTLSQAVAEMHKDIDAERAAYEASRQPSDPDWVEPDLSVFVVGNKLRKKLAVLPQDLLDNRYWAGVNIENFWCVFPWDALDIHTHTALAHTTREELPGHAPPPPSAAVAAAAQLRAAANGAATNGHELVNGAIDGAVAVTVAAPPPALNGIKAA